MPAEKKKILIVDDSETSAMYTCVLLSRMGFDVVPVQNGLEALKYLKADTPEMIIMDIDSRRDEAAVTLKHIKEDKKASRVPVVAISAGTRAEAEQACAEYKCCGHLTRPIEIKELHEVLQNCIFSNLGWTRKYIRTHYDVRVSVVHDGATYELFTQTLSEGGMYVRKRNPLPIGSDVTVEVPVGMGESVTLKGTVVFAKGLYGGVFTSPPGMAIEFRDVPSDSALRITDYVSRLLTEEILEYQE